MPIISRLRPGLYSGPRCGLRLLSFIKWEGYVYATQVGWRELKTGLTFSDPLINPPAAQPSIDDLDTIATCNDVRNQSVACQIVTIAGRVSEPLPERRCTGRWGRRLFLRLLKTSSCLARGKN